MSARQARGGFVLLLAVIMLVGAAATVRPTEASWTQATMAVNTPSSAQMDVLQPPAGPITCTDAGLYLQPWIHWNPPASGPTPQKYKITMRRGSPTGAIAVTAEVTDTKWQVSWSGLEWTTWHISIQAVYGTNWTSQYYATLGYKVDVFSVFFAWSTTCVGTYTVPQPAWNY